jgi:hypothetical protein
MFRVTFDLSDFARWDRKLAVATDSLIPQALAMLLNRAVENARNTLIQGWPHAVKSNNYGFIRASLMRTFATPDNLEAGIFDALGRGHLKELTEGGQHFAKKAMVAIPSSTNIRRGSHGVPSSLRPMSLSHAFIINRTGRGPAIWQRVPGRGNKIKLMYTLKPSVPIPMKWSAESDFNTVVRSEVASGFPGEMI